MAGSDLLRPLAQVRRKLRWLVVLHGLLRLTAALLLALLTCVVLDWFLALPGPARLLITVLLLATLGVAIWRLLARPLLRPVALTEIAVKVQERFGDFEQGLAGAVEFVEKGASGSPALVKRAIKSVARIAGRVRMNQAVRARPAAGQALVSMFAAVTTLSVGLAAPGWLYTGTLRYLDPLGPYEWPRRVAVRGLSGDALVAFGESFTCQMEVLRGASDRLRPAVVARDEAGQVTKVPLLRGRDGNYRWTFEALQRAFTYWFEAGDATTRAHPSRVRLVVRPAVRSAELLVYPPAYVGDVTPTRHVLSDRPVTALEGSRATLEMVANKPLVSSAGKPAGAWLVRADTEPVPLAAVEGDATAYRGQIDVLESTTFSVRLVDAAGFSSRDPQVYRIDMARDKAPDVDLLEPPPLLQATPDADVPLVISAEDDFGIDSLVLHAEVADGPSWPPIDLRPVTVVNATPRGVSARTDYLWSLAPAGLPPGRIITYAVEVRDNFELSGRRHAPLRSREGRIKIVSHAELAETLAERLQLLAGRLRQLLTDQLALQEDLGLTAGQARGRQTLTAPVSDSLLRAWGEQARLSARTRQLGRQFADLGELLDRNHSADRAGRAQMARFQQRLGELSAGPMSEASELIAAARLSADQSLRDQQLADASAGQQAAVTVLQELLSELDRWGNLQDVVRRTQEFLDRQQRITQATARTTGDMIGRRVEELSAEQVERLSAQAAAQERLAEDVLGLLRRIPAVAEALREKDPASADALVSAEQAAHRTALAERMKQAADAVRGNRGSTAAIDQVAAEKGLQEMLAGFESRRERILAELTKKLAEVEEELTRLIREEQELLEANQTARFQADQSRRYLAQAQDQELLKRRTQALAARLTDSPETSPVGRLLRQVLPVMTQAAASLTSGNGAEAETHQHAVLTGLQEALEALLEIRRRAEAEQAKRSLLAFRQDLVDVRDRQAALNLAVSELIGQLTDVKRLGRLEARKVRRFAAEQQALREKMSSLQERVASTVVYDWTVASIVEQMGDVAGRLDQRDLSGATVEMLADLLARLEQLIDALFEEASPPEDEFASGGGAGMQGQPRGPVPTLAELKLLKMLQLEVNRRTRVLAESLESGEPSEETLSKISELGERQEQIRELAEKMIEQTWLHEVK